VTKFCMSVDIHDVIRSATFCDDRLRGLGVASGRISRFPIDLRRRPYNTLALPCECVNADGDFQYFGLSAVDIDTDIVVGGTAILYRKTLASQITVIDSDESRITCIQINTEHGPLLLLNVYMPTNYGDEASLELYRECLAKLHALIVDSYAVHTIIAGDFNCSPSSNFFCRVC